MIIHTQTPLNAETPLSRVRESFITPEKNFFVRNHGGIPQINSKQYTFQVNGLVRQSLDLTLSELQKKFTTKTITATLQCAGNRRIDLNRIDPIAGEVPWNAGAIGNAQWTGISVGEVLAAAEIDPRAAHVEFLGLDYGRGPEMGSGFGSSIPLSKAMSEEVLLAYAMNGKPLSPEHGSPLRVIVPGYIGARSVKWLREIRVLAQPSINYFQSHAYKIFPPDTRAKTADWATGLSLGTMPVNAVITRPMDGEEFKSRRVLLQGYAISGGRSIERVELTPDDGTNWVIAELAGSPSPWTWRLWEKEISFEPGPVRLAVRAWDSATQTQPEDAGKIWNFKGYLNNAWHRIYFTVAI